VFGNHAEHVSFQEGTAEELLKKLADRADKEAKHHRAWPVDATRLSGALRRIAPNLRELGILVEFLPRHEFRRPIRISSPTRGTCSAGSPIRSRAGAQRHVH